MRQSKTSSARTIAASSRRLLSCALRNVSDGLLRSEAHARRPGARAERLEQRHLLTDLFGGESLIYQSFDFGEVGDDGEIETITVRVDVQGSQNTTVQLWGIGQTANGFGLSDLSGQIISPYPGRSGDVRGGVGGAIGSSKLIQDGPIFISETGGLQQANLTDYIGSIIPSLGGAALLATQNLIQFSSIATNSQGQNFGLQLVDIQFPAATIRQVQLAEFNTDATDFDPIGQNSNRVPGFGGDLALRTNVGDALFRGDIIESMIAAIRAVEPDPFFPPEDPEDPLADRQRILNIIGADFAPGDDSTLYIAANVSVGRQTNHVTPTLTDVAVPFVFAVDMDSLTAGGANVSVIASDFWADEQSFDAQTVSRDVTAFSMLDSNTFTIFGTFTERLNEGTQQENVAATTGLLIHDVNPSQTRQFVDRDDVIFIGDVDVITLEYRPVSANFNPPNDLSRLYGLIQPEGGAQGPQLIRFDSGIVGPFTVIGGLLNVDGSAAGQEATALSWDPTIANPFDDGIGAFVTFDTSTDHFLVVDQRPRGVTSSSLALYNIQVLNSDASTRISVYAIDNQGQPIDFEGDPNPIADVFNPETGELELVEAPDGSGALYLGLKFIVGEDPPQVITIDFVPAVTTEGSGTFQGKLYNGVVRPGLYTVNSSLGGFFYAGIITGNVRIEGALGDLWAGAILTGDAGLQGAGEPDNFGVFGDAGNIVSATSIGNEKETGDGDDIDADETDLIYSSRTEIAIGGRVNSIRAAGSIAAAIDVRGDDPPANADLSNTFYKRRPNAALRELERQGIDDERPNLFVAGTPVVEQFYNDTFETFEPVGSLGDGTIRINGLISGDIVNTARDDSVDYYGIGMMAGQEFVVHLSSIAGSPTLSLQVGVFDPEGRLIATDYEDNVVAISSRRNLPMRIKATIPGVYRIAIAPAPDADFNEAGGDYPDQLYTTESYLLTVQDVGNITLGGVKAQGHIYTEGNTVNGTDWLRLWRGDLGVLESLGGAILSFGIAPPAVRVSTGNARQISALSLGFFTTAPSDIIGFINVRVPKASIGALRAFGTTGDFAGDIFFNWTGVFDADNLPLVSQAIGDDIQLVQAGRDVLGNFIVGRGIGSIVAGRDWGAPFGIGFGSRNNTGGTIFTNVDDLNDDGFLDMLSIGANVGVSSFDGTLVGGPGIDMGTNGNFRYWDLAPGGTLVRDPLFGQAVGDPFQTLPPGEIFNFVDDSGTAASVVPIAGARRDPNDPNDNPQAQLSVLTYPVRSGGSILVTANSTSGMEIRTNNRGPGATVEVGNIRTSGIGRPVVRDIDPLFLEGEPELILDGSFFDPNDPLDLADPFEDLRLIFSGTNVDIFSIDATATGATGGKFTEIINNTSGEIVDLTAASVGTLRADRLGLPVTRGPSDLRVVGTRSSFYPFNLQPYLIGVEGSIIELQAEEIANVYAGIALGFTIGGPDDGGDGDGGGGGGGGGTGGGGGGDGGGGGTGQSDGGGSGGTGGGGNGTDTGGGGTGTGTGTGGGPLAQIGNRGDGIGGVAGGNAGGGVGGIGTEVLGELAGIIGNVRPNFDGVDDPKRFEGIVGPIVAATPGTGRVDGELTFVDIGEGLLPTGSGNVGFGGLFVEGYIVELVGTNADIRGDVVALEFNSIRLDGGSIIHADILGAPVRGNDPSNPNFAHTRETEIVRSTLPAYVEAGPEDSDTVFFEFDEILITGGGGILGSVIEAADIFNIRVSDGFGMLYSTLITTVEGEVELVDVDGLGIRNVIIGQGRDVDTVRARGDAELLNLNDFSASVDLSGEGLEFDPFTGFTLAPINDLRRALGLPDDANPRRKRITNSGVMENVRISGSRDANRVEAVVIRSNLDSLNPGAGFEQTAEGFGGGNAQSPDHPMSIDFGRTVTDVNARSTHGLRLESGDLVRFNAGWDVFNSEVRISGHISDVTIGADANPGVPRSGGGRLWRDSSVRADGPDGFLASFKAYDVFGFVSGDVGIGTMTVDRDLFSPTDQPATALVTPSTVRALSRIERIIVGRHVRTGAYIRATQQIGTLQVGGDIQQGAVVQATQIDDLDVAGNIFGDIVLTG